jgi:nicotinamidase-related amidase
MAHSTQMTAANAGLLVIDVQEKLLPLIPGADRLVQNIAFLMDGARLMVLPVQATEQYPKGLGPTVKELAQRVAERPAKVEFSSCAIPFVVERFRTARRTHIVLAGIETHVCVLHSALDLLALGFRVFVARDAVGSRYAVDHETALARMEQAGVIPITVETAVFEWVGGAAVPQFKDVSALVQRRMKQLPGLNGKQ